MGHILIDSCSFWVINQLFCNMTSTKIDFTKVFNDDQIYDQLMSNYEQLGSDWIAHQWNWMNNIYKAFKDHYKYLIIISLIEKTLQFYDQMNIKLRFDEFYAKPYFQIEKFNITELCEKLSLPKETVRRKVLELEKMGVLKRKKKQIFIDRSVFSHVKPSRQIGFTSKYIYLFCEILNNQKILSKKLEIKTIENLVKKNFSICWRWFYRLQIPLVIGYHDMFEDLTTYHIWGTVAMNQAFNYKRDNIKKNFYNQIPDYKTFNESLIEGKGASAGVSAMSISEMTNIPRATVIRKCKFLLKNDYLVLNKKKHYILGFMNRTKVLPYQKKVFRHKAKFLRKIINLLTIS